MNYKIEQIDKIIDYARGRLNKSEKKAFDAVINNDPALEKMIEVIRGMKSEAEQIEWLKLKKSSHDIFDRLLNDVKRRNKKGNDKKGVNIYDSGLLPLPDGIRPAKVDSRRLKFLIGEAQLEISVYPVSPKSFELMGQIAGFELDSVITIQLKGAGEKVSVEANQFHIFRINRIPAGRYKLLILQGKAIIGEVDLEI